jgi:homoserine dehydrogenase
MRCSRAPARPAGLSGIPVFTDPDAVFALDPELVIDALPGNTAAETLVARAVAEGRHVITANKRTAARRPDLVRTARAKGQTFACSAAVGGGAPILETAAQLAASGRKTTRVRGVLNGTSNFVLDRLARGEALSSAVAAAQAAGFAEADPSADLDGLDAAHKLVLIARTLWGLDLALSAIKTESIAQLPPGAAPAVARGGAVLRQVARLTRTAQGVSASVRLDALPADDPLARGARRRQLRAVHR